MDSKFYRRWQEAAPPFDGITLYSPYLTLPNLRRLLIPIVDILYDHARAMETRLWRLRDWHEHDGWVNEAAATVWEDVQALLISDDALLGACTGETYVRTAFFDDKRHFLFRIYIPDISDNPFHTQDDASLVQYGIFDLTGDEWLTDRARDASLAADVEAGLQTMNAKAFFDRNHAS
jgi:hypothetical protein